MERLDSNIGAAAGLKRLGIATPYEAEIVNTGVREIGTIRATF